MQAQAADEDESALLGSLRKENAQLIENNRAASRKLVHAMMKQSSQARAATDEPASSESATTFTKEDLEFLRSYGDAFARGDRAECVRLRNTLHSQLLEHRKRAQSLQAALRSIREALAVIQRGASSEQNEITQSA